MPKVPQQDTPVQPALTKPCDNLNANELRYVALVHEKVESRRGFRGRELGVWTHQNLLGAWGLGRKGP